MGSRQGISSILLSALLLGALPAAVLGGQVLQTNGFVTCSNNPAIQVTKMNITYDRSTREVVFDVAGTSNVAQRVMASLDIYAYGNQVYSKTFNPCAQNIAQLCPVPVGTFSATGKQVVPAQYASMIPSIAFTLPNLDGEAKFQLKPIHGGGDLACIVSTVTNGKTVNIPAVKYAAAGIAGAALIMSGVSALAGAGHAGVASSSPTFTETLHWFQSIAMNGMLSVPYPSIYRSFTQNFGFSTGLIGLTPVQKAIDRFRAATGGNLTHDSVYYLQHSTLVFPGNTNLKKRFADSAVLYARHVTTNVNGTKHTVGSGSSGSGSGSGNGTTSQQNFVGGIKGYAEQLMIPQSNTFMTVLLVFAIVIAAITVGILLFKVILEAWALFGSFPKRLTGFRKRYWWLVAKTITNLILCLYGVWTLYCIYQFISGDSWAAKLLAGVTLGLFTALLLGFTIKIWHKAHQAKKLEGDTSVLFEDKETWNKYSIFYGDFKRSYWWIFVPSIIYMFAKGCVIAAGEGHGLFQTGGQLVVDSLMMILLLWLRPYTLKSGTWINVVIQVIRVLSVACILVFVEELQVNQTTKTITGLVLIVVQSVLTVLLGILIAINSIVLCCKANPHRRQRKENEKLNRAGDDLTALDARNSLLMYPVDQKGFQTHAEEVPTGHFRGRSQNGYDMVSNRDATPTGFRDDSHDRLAYAGAPMGARRPSRNTSLGGDSIFNRPTLPDIEYKGLAI